MELKSSVLNKEAIDYIKQNSDWKNISELPKDFKIKEQPCILYCKDPESNNVNYMIYVKDNRFIISTLYSIVKQIGNEILETPVNLYKFKLTNGEEVLEFPQHVTKDGYVLLELKIDEEKNIKWSTKQIEDLEKSLYKD